MRRSVWPASRLGWCALWLALAAVAWGLLLPVLPQLLGPLRDSSRVRIPIGFTSAIIEVLLALAALVAGGFALRRGERSWLALAAFVLAIIIGGFWIFFAAGEILFPH